jgi:uncharacterized protein (DUF427 family)
MFNGQWLADSHPLLVWEWPYYPTYYFPNRDVVGDVLEPATDTEGHEALGEGSAFNVRVGDRVVPGAALQYPDSPVAEIRIATRFEWGAMDHWFEEDEEVFVHARSPYHRIETLHSSKHIRIELDGVTLADSTHPTLLLESGLPTRYYLPKADVRMDLLTPTRLTTGCPYKGNASYWSYGDHDNIVWGYSFPVAESAKIAGLVSFYNEKVDVYVDGALEDKPVTQFA